MDQGIYCKNCGNYERLQFSPDGRYVKCPKCGAETPLYSEYKINEVSIDGVLSQDEKLRNGVKLLELQQYEQAWNVFQELTRERSADYRSWFGLARAATNDFTVDRVLPYDAHALDNAEYTASSDPEGAQVVAEAKQFYQYQGQIEAQKEEAEKAIGNLNARTFDRYAAENKYREKFKNSFPRGNCKEPTIEKRYPWFLITLALACWAFFSLWKNKEAWNETIKLPNHPSVNWTGIFLLIGLGVAVIASILLLVLFLSGIVQAARCNREKKAWRMVWDEANKEEGQFKREIQNGLEEQNRRVAQAEQETANLLADKQIMLARWNQIMLNGKAVK